ncbi:hypothetical protein ACV229_33710 [Burkholderia sp. MR1-5-21]
MIVDDMVSFPPGSRAGEKRAGSLAESDKRAEHGDRLADDQVLHLESALVGFE